MSDKFIHTIPESSSFFQGHVNQLYSEDRTSFQIRMVYEDNNEQSSLNLEKYRRTFADLINEKINKMKALNCNIPPINPDEIIFRALKLSDGKDAVDMCGRSAIYPTGAICMKDNCKRFFRIGEDRKCGHRADDPYEQITFVGYCQLCGNMNELQYMTNLNSNCSKCGQTHGMSILDWKRKDDLTSYYVKCFKCGKRESLFFYNCDHTKDGVKQFNADDMRYIGVPARSGTVLHSFVKTTPDMPRSFDIGKNGIHTTQAKVMSEAFQMFFPEKMEEAQLYLPQFKQKLIKDDEFWERDEVSSSRRSFEKVLGPEAKKEGFWTQDRFIQFLRKVLQSAQTLISIGAEKDIVAHDCGIDRMIYVMESMGSLRFTQADMEGCALLSFRNTSNTNSHAPIRKDVPREPLSPATYIQFGLKSVIHYSNINMIQALLGFIAGSTRRDVVIFTPVYAERTDKKPTIYTRCFLTEGIMFQLDYGRIIKWLEDNGKLKQRPTGGEDSDIFRELMYKNGNERKDVEKLLHTYSHMLIQQSTINTGLDVTSLSEIIYPTIASIFIYSTNSINTGGIEYTYDYHLEEWLNRLKELATDCPQDPACMELENGACNACSFVPEFVCERFNQDLDRSTLVGGPRFNKGYLQ